MVIAVYLGFDGSSLKLYHYIEEKVFILLVTKSSVGFIVKIKSVDYELLERQQNLRYHKTEFSNFAL